MVALITPFKNDAVDYPTLEKLIDFHLANGTSCIVPCGTTGESATLSMEEHMEVIRFTVNKVKGRVPVLAGTGANCTREAIELAQAAKEAGADAHLSVTPYYNKPSQEGLFLHYKAIAEAVKLPMVLYNVPGRSVVSLSPETIGRLSQIDGIIGVKEASGDMKQVAETFERVRSGFLMISGDDFTNLPLMALGGVGAISVTANIAPKLLSDTFAAYKKGSYDEARKLHLQSMPLHRAMFIETSPVPVKTAAHLTGLIPTLEFRLPLAPLKAENAAKLKDVLKNQGLLK